MSIFHLNQQITLTVSAGQDPCLVYAESELVRLLKRLGCSASVKRGYPESVFGIGVNTAELPKPEDLKYDGFQILFGEDSAVLCGLEPKGLLNAVYEFAEQLGITFLKPGPDGEWFPEQVFTPGSGLLRKNPRFPHRGLFLSTKDCFSSEEHLVFLAKLKYNACSCHNTDDAVPEIYRKLGMRHEFGGHGLSACLDRKLFAEHPEYFRMFQPEDFHGKRMADSNLCVTNPETRKLVVKTFAEKIKEASPDLYAIHAWADDLPGGGWCMCPSCRSFSSADQNMLGMKLLCRGAEAAGTKTRIPVIAYHDTLFPGEQTRPEPRMFLLWAPRERCYAHRLDDPECARNRVHWEALKQWAKRFEGIDDAHTFEYYQDQLLFTGLYPFLPEVIAGDMDAYEKIGIQSHMTLQVASWNLLPDYNGLFFARAHWEKGLDRNQFLSWITGRIAGTGAAAFAAFLNDLADCFQKALIMCGHDPAIYLDYRWLPESNTEFAKKAALGYRTASEAVAAAAEQFRKALPGTVPERFAKLAGKEIQRAVFESAELLSMHYQQSAMVCFGKAQLDSDAEAAKQGCELLRKNIEAEQKAAALARETGYPEDWHYLSARSPWAIREASDKLKKYSGFTI